jgi:hypothetical protein
MAKPLIPLAGTNEGRHSGRGKSFASFEEIAPVPSSRASLSRGAVAPETLIDVAPGPAALWSLDRRSCVLSDRFRRLLGFEEGDFEDDPSLWLQRIHPEDHARFSRAWEKLEKGQKKIRCSYRFLPKGRTQEIRLQEVAFSYPIAHGFSRGICSLYSVEAAAPDKSPGLQPTPELVRGLTHEIGNNLQAITGEVDLLRISGLLTAGASTSIKRGIEQIQRLAREIEEYLFPPALQLRSEDPAAVLKEVVGSIEKELVLDGIRVALVAKESLPRMLVDGQFGKALRGVIEFSRALLANGGELKIEAGMRREGDDRYIEVKFVSSSATALGVEERDVFRPFLRVNDYRVGLSMAVARQVLRRHFGKIQFHKEENRGIFCILMKVAPEG